MNIAKIVYENLAKSIPVDKLIIYLCNIENVKVEQNWQEGDSIFVFSDESCIIISGPEVSVGEWKYYKLRNNI
jgi:hypothetical protein